MAVSAACVLIETKYEQTTYKRPGFCQSGFFPYHLTLLVAVRLRWSSISATSNWVSVCNLPSNARYLTRVITDAEKRSFLDMR